MHITQLRPGSDAAQKLHLGDQILSLDGYGVGRKDLWQLQYFLSQIAPKPTTEFTLRVLSGDVRKVQVITKFIQGKRLEDLSLDMGDNDLWNLILEEEADKRLLRQRFVEQDDVMFWKMPAFNLEDRDVDHLIHIARQHKALVLDLRDNPGGYVTTLTRIIGSFFDHDVKIATQVMRKGEKDYIAKSRGKDIFTGKLIVLVDSESASAAELFARVIQLEHRGTVIGDRSSGSVMEARLYPFRSGTDVFVVFYGASITSANLVMSDGKSLEKVGVTPDVFVLPTAAQLAAGDDPALAKAAELAGAKLEPAAGKLFPFEWAPL